MEVSRHQMGILPTGELVEVISVAKEVTDTFHYPDASDGEDDVQSQHFVGRWSLGVRCLYV